MYPSRSDRAGNGTGLIADRASPLDARRPPGTVALVSARLFSKVLCFLLLTTWSVATEHCSLEAIGLIGAETATTPCCDDGEKTECSDDSCQVVEGTACRAPSDQLLVAAPSLVAAITPEFLTLITTLVPPPATLPRWSYGIEAPSLGWLPTRHFARRAAPLSRAPGSLV